MSIDNCRYLCKYAIECKGIIMKCSHTYLKTVWVYSSDVVTSVVDNALWSTSCTRLTHLFIATLWSSRVLSDERSWSSFIVMIEKNWSRRQKLTDTIVKVLWLSCFTAKQSTRKLACSVLCFHCCEVDFEWQHILPRLMLANSVILEKFWGV
jgi:hypothetical protein